MKTIKIREDDFLWKLYRLKFEIEGGEFRPPASLCPYFWGAVRGAGLYLERRCPIATLFGATAAACAIFMALTLADSSDVASLLLLPVTIGAFAVFAGGMFATVFALSHRVRALLRRSPVLEATIAVLTIGSFGTIGAYSAYREGTLVPAGKFFLAAVLLCVVTAFTLVLVLRYLPALAARCPGLSLRARTLMERVERLSKTIAAVVVAQKRRVCPPVEPPPVAGPVT